MESFLGKRILVITAHPDDEGYAMAGSIYKNHTSGGSTYLLCATYGEKGNSHLKKKTTQKELKKIRKKELLKSAKILHIEDVRIVGIPDAKVKLHKERMRNAGAKYAKQVSPDAIVSFASDGISGHFDHVTAGVVAKKIARDLKIPFFAATLPPKVAKHALAHLRARRHAGHYKSQIVFEKPSLRIPINKAIKKKAIRAHSSQMDSRDAFTGFPAFAVAELLTAEYFA